MEKPKNRTLCLTNLFQKSGNFYKQVDVDRQWSISEQMWWGWRFLCIKISYQEPI